MGNDPGNTFDKMPSRNSEQTNLVVSVDEFYIGKYPVTARQWSKVMGVQVEGVKQDFPFLLNWDEVQEFISRLNDITGLKFRVPTEAEWEYAARCSGKDKNWSGIFDGSAIHNNASPARCKVGQDKPDSLAFFDMLGNSSEWVVANFPKQPLQNGPQGRTKSARNGGRLVICSTLHRYLPKTFTFSYTFHKSYPSSDKALRFGFRLAHSTI